jgi:hypothetical protein
MNEIGGTVSTGMDEIKTKLNTMELKHEGHRAWHNGQESAKKQSASNSVLVAKWIVVAISVSGFFGAIIWYLASVTP